MKIVHAADLHIDSPLRGLTSYAGAPVDRVRLTTREAFVRVIGLCLRESARFLVLAGDVFDQDWKDVNTGLFFLHQLSRLREISCRVLLLRGNHDCELTRSLRYPDHVHEFAPPKTGKGARSREGTQRSYVFEADGVAFHGVSYPEREVRHSLLPEYPAAQRGLLDIGVLHTNATGTQVHKSYAPCTVSELAEKEYGYWALGHVHGHDVLSRTPWVVYPGNTQGRHANESGPKGCVVLDVRDGAVASVTFTETSVMRWHRADVTLAREDDVDDLHDLVRARLAELVDDGLAAVRLRVTGACRAHAAICRDPERIATQIRADAIEHAGDLWVEKIELATTPETPLDELRQARGLVADLLRHLEHVREDEGDAELMHLGRVLDPLKKKLGSELTELGEDIDLGRPEVLRRILDEAEALLAQRLTEGNPEG